MSDESEREEERAQMARLAMLRNLMLHIARKYAAGCAVLAVFAFGLVFGLLAYRTTRAPDRFETTISFVFNPRSAGNIRTPEASEVMRILTRRTLMRRLAEALQLGEGEAARLSLDIAVTQVRQARNVFEVSVKGPGENGTVRKANAFADLALKEYVAYRTADLDEWMETIHIRQGEIQDQIAKNEQAELELCRKIGVTSPTTEAERLSRALSDRRAALIEAKLAESTAALNRTKVENELKDISPKVVENADTVRALLERRRANDARLSEIRHLYTPNNPKYQLCEEKIRLDEADLQKFLKDNGIAETDTHAVAKYAKLQDELKGAIAREEVCRHAIEALENECTRMDKQVHELLGLMPDFDRLAGQRNTLRTTLADVEETISNIRYLESTCAADLSLTEKAAVATAQSPFGKKVFFLSLAAALAAAGALLTFLVLLEMSLGRVAGSREVSFHPELRLLGALPRDGAFANETEARQICDGIFYRFHRECAEGTVFICSLAGGEPSERLATAFGWNLAMSGQRAITIQIVKAVNFTEPAGATLLSGVVLSGENAYLPVADPQALSPGELELLRQDVAGLCKTYGIVFIRRHASVRPGEIFMAQMTAFCDRTLAYVGAKRTARSVLNALISIHRQAHENEILVVTTGVTRAAEIKEGNYR